MTYDEHNILDEESGSQCELQITPSASARDLLSYKPPMRPFSAPQLLKREDSDQKENVAVDIRMQKKPKSAVCRAQSARRPNWKTKVDDIPTLDVLCQQEIKLPTGSSLEYTDFSHWWSGTPESRSDDVCLIGDKKDMHKIYGEVGKMIANQLQKDKTSLGNKNGMLKSHENSTRKAIVLKDGIDDHEVKGSLKRNVEPTESDSDDKKNKKEIVPLTIEDEMKKPNVRIFSIRPQGAKTTEAKPSETRPIVYNNQGHRFVTYKSLSTEAISNVDRSNFREKFRNQSAKSAIHVMLSPVVQSNLKYATRLIDNKQKRLCASAIVKKETRRLWSAKLKINVHILAADGTSEVIRVTKDSSESAPKSSDTSFENALPINKVSSKAIRMLRPKQECSGVSPVINGVNPDAELCPIIVSSRMRTPMNSSPHFPAGRPTASSHFHKISDADQAVKWNYISIAKQIKTPGSDTYLFPKKECPRNNGVSFANAQLDLKERTKTFQHSLDHVKLKGVPAASGPLSLNTQQQTTFGSTPSADNTEEMNSVEKITGNSQMGNAQVTEVEKEQAWLDPLQICGFDKSSSDRPLDTDPGTEPHKSDTDEVPEHHVDQVQEEMPLLAPESTPRPSSAFPVINIPTAQNEEFEEFETARTK
ncbi:uncharacterized protein C1orf141 homolog isoform X2 [Lissotriton helveticus]